VLTIGRGKVKPLSLLFLGNHYEVVGGVQNGTAVGAETAYYPTAKDGNCLFASILIIVCNGRAPKNPEDAILSLRKMVSEELSDEAKSARAAGARGDAGARGPRGGGVEAREGAAHYHLQGKEYCLDKIGQLVPRFLRRNCSQENKDELSGDEHDKDRGLYPTGLSPFKIKGNVASGTGGNQIKKESPEMSHVQGHKPSPFLSATALDEDALNPKGKSFGQVMTVVIDLSHLEPVHITALYTSKAICYFLLDGFTGDKQQTAQNARDEQSKVKPSSGDLARRDKSLSEKEWQALLDVIRTAEVLIDCVVPEEAVEKQKQK
jgi:hypothetical protein